jgi:hypothetical protein
MKMKEIGPDDLQAAFDVFFQRLSLLFFELLRKDLHQNLSIQILIYVQNEPEDFNKKIVKNKTGEFICSMSASPFGIYLDGIQKVKNRTWEIVKEIKRATEEIKVKICFWYLVVFNGNRLGKKKMIRKKTNK